LNARPFPAIISVPAVVEVAETFAGQFLTIHAVTDHSRQRLTTAVPPDLERLVGYFAEAYHTRLNDWTCRLLELEAKGRKVVLWGGGSKATSFLNLLRPAIVDYVVDVNGRKQEKYVVGTGQQIVPPEFLREYMADEIICMNPNYLDEITRQVWALGLDANLVCA
jgi:hypothetical protein